MTLRQLEAQFVQYVERDGRVYHHHVATLAEAQGVDFLCPLCFHNNDGPVGTHHVLCWFTDRGVPDSAFPQPGRWSPAGSGLDDLTFIGPAAASVLLTGGCKWHGFVKNGEATLS